MSSGRSEESDEDFKDIILDDPEYLTHGNESTPDSYENPDTLENQQSSEGNRSRDPSREPETGAGAHPGSLSRSPGHEPEHQESDPNSHANVPYVQNNDGSRPGVDEYQDFHSVETTPTRQDPEHLEHLRNHYGAYYAPSQSSTEYNAAQADGLNAQREHRTLDSSQLDPGHRGPEPELELTQSENTELSTRLSDMNLHEAEPRTATQQDEVAEFNLSDNQLSDQMSEPTGDLGFSDIDLTPERSTKSKHRKKFKTTTKGIESLFHKTSIGRSSKSKTKSPASPTSPAAKENVVVTTSTSTMSTTKRRDKTPCWTNYEIPSKPGRKGPTLGVFYDSLKSAKNYQRTESGKDQKCIVLQTPDSLERYLHPFQVVSNYYLNTNYIKYYSPDPSTEDGVMNSYYYINMMTQRKSLLPYYVTKTIFGNVPGMGRVLVCGTQCGKIIFYSFFTLDELLVLDTRTVYDRYLSRENSIDSESGFDMNKAIDSTLFEVNCLALITTFMNYSTLLAIGNHLGHLLLYQVPKMQLVKLIYPTNLDSTTVFSGASSLNTASRTQTPSSFNTYNSICSLTSELDHVLIDELELQKIRRYKNTTNNGDKLGLEDEVVFITCLEYCPSTGDLWVGYGNGSFSIYSGKFKLKYFYTSNHLNEGNAGNLNLDNENVYSVNNFEFCTYEQIVLVLYGNVKVDIFTFEGRFLSTISCTRLTNNTVPISTIQVSSNANNSSVLYIGLMDGSLLVKQIVYSTNSSPNNLAKEVVEKSDQDDVLVELLSNTIEFILLHNLNYRFDGEVNLGAPVTSICPVPSQQLVLLGNASGGLSVVSNLVT